MSRLAYPLFVPPGDLAINERWEWDRPATLRYRAWLEGALDARVAGLLRYFSVHDTIGPDAIAEVGRRASVALVDPPFSDATGTHVSLTAAGYAVSADLGLLVARALLRDSEGRLRWEVVRTPRSDASFNLPALFGFVDGLFLEPLGGAVAEGRAVIQGRRDGMAWRAIFDHWVERIPPADLVAP